MKKFVTMMVMVIMALAMMNISYAEYDMYTVERDLRFYEYIRDEKPDAEVFARFAVGYKVESDYYVEDYVIFGKDGMATDAGWRMQIVDGEVRHEDFSECTWEEFTEYKKGYAFEIVKDDEYQTLCNVDNYIKEISDELEVLWVKYY